jgi:hypothetical protein
MAKPKSAAAKTKLPKRAEQTPKGGKIGGRYTYRFSGFARVPTGGTEDRPNHIIGVGHFELTAQGKLVGGQWSTIAPLSGPGPSSLWNAYYALVGDYTVRPDGSATTTVFFHRDSPRTPPAMVDRFEIVMAGGPDRLWLISTGPRFLPGNTPVDELVSVEAIRTP